MRRNGLLRAIGWAAVAATLAGCAPADAPASGDPAAATALSLSYADVLAPAAFSRDAPAVADGPDGAPGLWAVVPGLPRPERARATNRATGAETIVALYDGRGGPGGAIRLSGAAAEALGIGATPVEVSVVALRREPRIAAR